MPRLAFTFHIFLPTFIFFFQCSLNSLLPYVFYLSFLHNFSPPYYHPLPFTPQPPLTSSPIFKPHSQSLLVIPQPSHTPSLPRLPTTPLTIHFSYTVISPSPLPLPLHPTTLPSFTLPFSPLIFPIPDSPSVLPPPHPPNGAINYTPSPAPAPSSPFMRLLVLFCR